MKGSKRLLLTLSLAITISLGTAGLNAEAQELTIDNTARQKAFPLAIGKPVQQRIDRTISVTERWYNVRLFPERSYNVSVIPEDVTLPAAMGLRSIVRISVFEDVQTKPLVTNDTFSVDQEPSLGLGARAGFITKGSGVNPLIGPSRPFSIKLEGQDGSQSFAFQITIDDTTMYGQVPPGYPFTINVTNATGDEVFVKSAVIAGDRAPANTGFANFIPALTAFVSPDFLTSPLTRTVVLQHDGPPRAIQAYLMARDNFTDQRILLPLVGR